MKHKVIKSIKRPCKYPWGLIFLIVFLMLDIWFDSDKIKISGSLTTLYLAFVVSNLALYLFYKYLDEYKIVKVRPFFAVLFSKENTIKRCLLGISIFASDPLTKSIVKFPIFEKKNKYKITIIRVSNLNGKVSPCRGERCQFKSGLTRKQREELLKARRDIC